MQAAVGRSPHHRFNLQIFEDIGLYGMVLTAIVAHQGCLYAYFWTHMRPYTSDASVSSPHNKQEINNRWNMVGIMAHGAMPFSGHVDVKRRFHHMSKFKYIALPSLEGGFGVIVIVTQETFHNVQYQTALHNPVFIRCCVCDAHPKAPKKRGCLAAHLTGHACLRIIFSCIIWMVGW